MRLAAIAWLYSGNMLFTGLSGDGCEFEGEGKEYIRSSHLTLGLRVLFLAVSWSHYIILHWLAVTLTAHLCWALQVAAPWGAPSRGSGFNPEPRYEVQNTTHGQAGSALPYGYLPGAVTTSGTPFADERRLHHLTWKQQSWRSKTSK